MLLPLRLRDPGSKGLTCDFSVGKYGKVEKETGRIILLQSWRWKMMETYGKWFLVLKTGFL